MMPPLENPHPESGATEPCTPKRVQPASSLSLEGIPRYKWDPDGMTDNGGLSFDEIGYLCEFVRVLDITPLLQRVQELETQRDGYQEWIRSLQTIIERQEADLAALRAERDRLQAENARLKQGIEDDGDGLYCPKCGSCGISDCCEPHMCKFAQAYADEFAELNKECEAAESRLLALDAYVQHKPECPANPASFETGPTDCTCGLAALIETGAT